MLHIMNFLDIDILMAHNDAAIITEYCSRMQKILMLRYL